MEAPDRYKAVMSDIYSGASNNTMTYSGITYIMIRSGISETMIPSGISDTMILGRLSYIIIRSGILDIMIRSGISDIINHSRISDTIAMVCQISWFVAEHYIQWFAISDTMIHSGISDNIIAVEYLKKLLECHDSHSKRTIDHTGFHEFIMSDTMIRNGLSWYHDSQLNIR